jgi:hypothetical protein
MAFQTDPREGYRPRRAHCMQRCEAMSVWVCLQLMDRQFRRGRRSHALLIDKLSYRVVPAVAASTAPNQTPPALPAAPTLSLSLRIPQNNQHSHSYSTFHIHIHIHIHTLYCDQCLHSFELTSTFLTPGIDSPTRITMGGSSSPPFLYDPVSQWSFNDYHRGKPYNPKAVTQASRAPRPQRPPQEGPLVNFNRHPDSVRTVYL